MILFFCTKFSPTLDLSARQQHNLMFVMQTQEVCAAEKTPWMTEGQRLKFRSGECKTL